MSSKRRGDSNIVNAYGKSMTKEKATSIDRHNTIERIEGNLKDTKAKINQQNVAATKGETDYKSYVKRRLEQLSSILGVKN